MEVNYNHENFFIWFLAESDNSKTFFTMKKNGGFFTVKKMVFFFTVEKIFFSLWKKQKSLRIVWFGEKSNKIFFVVIIDFQHLELFPRVIFFSTIRKNPKSPDFLENIRNGLNRRDFMKSFIFCEVKIVFYFFHNKTWCLKRRCSYVKNIFFLPNVIDMDPNCRPSRFEAKEPHI